MQALPSSAPNGTIVILEVDAANGVYWRFRYNAFSGSSFKWQFLGGPPLRSDVDSTEATSSASYVDLTTPQSVTLPRGGDYDFQFSCGGQSTGAGVLTVGLTVGGASQVECNSNDPGTSQIHQLARQKRLTGRTLGDVFKMQYKTSAGTATFRERSFSVTPVRCS